MNNNKLIGDFMGVVFHDDENQYYNADGLHIGNTLQYHTSWDWLMPVAKKCINPEDNTEGWDKLAVALTTCDIDEVYQAVVEFIKEQSNDNKLIGDFMDIQNTGLSVYAEHAYQYDSSWDWLIPVVNKIENEGFDPHGIIDNALGGRGIEDVHDACVTLIKAYNNEEKENTKRVR